MDHLPPRLARPTGRGPPPHRRARRLLPRRRAASREVSVEDISVESQGLAKRGGGAAKPTLAQPFPDRKTHIEGETTTNVITEAPDVSIGG
jgi:hypothetical protein